MEVLTTSVDGGTTGEPFLGVARSATGRRWVGPAAEVERLGLAIAQGLGLPEIVGRVLAARGVLPETAEAFLNPTLRALMPDPSVLAGMDAAAGRLARAAAGAERIAVFGDYDVDGAASVALIRAWLAMLGRDSTPYVPDRIDEGYGPNVPAMRALARDHDLILCVDCGTLSHEPVAAARALGADVIIADHHLAGETLPDATAVVNPNRHDDDSGLGQLCAAGVVFLLLVAANRELRRQGWFRQRTEPDLMALLDLVAVATVADVAPLTGLNRALVRQGLGVLARRGRPGLAALADVAGLSAPPTSWDLGFALGPRINAGGRVGEAGLGERLLTTACPHEAAAIAESLDRLNRERREIEAAVLEAAIAQVEARDPAAPMVWAAGEGWHPGVVGIVAGRLKDRFNRPAVVIGLEGGEGKGSGRSVPGVDIGSAVAALARDGALLKGGGHLMAAGLKVAADALDDGGVGRAAGRGGRGRGGTRGPPPRRRARAGRRHRRAGRAAGAGRPLRPRQPGAAPRLRQRRRAGRARGRPGPPRAPRLGAAWRLAGRHRLPRRGERARRAARGGSGGAPPRAPRRAARDRRLGRAAQGQAEARGRRPAGVSGRENPSCNTPSLSLSTRHCAPFV